MSFKYDAKITNIILKKTKNNVQLAVFSVSAASIYEYMNT